MVIKIFLEVLFLLLRERLLYYGDSFAANIERILLSVRTSKLGRSIFKFPYSLQAKKGNSFFLKNKNPLKNNFYTFKDLISGLSFSEAKFST